MVEPGQGPPGTAPPLDFATAPLDQLSELIDQQIIGLSETINGVDVLGNPLSPDQNTGADMDALGIDPNTITEATTKLVEGGLLEMVSAALTPDVLEAIQAAAEAYAPGLYDVTNEADLVEVVEAIANGTIPVGTGGAGPGLPAGLPPGLPPGGDPGLGAPAPGGLPPGAGGGGGPVF